MSLFKELRIKGTVEIDSDKTSYGEGVFILTVNSMTVFNTVLDSFSIPEPEKREVIHRINAANTFCSETVGEYPSFLEDSEIQRALRGKRFVAHVYKNSITVFMANFNDEGPVRDFLQKAKFRLQKDGKLVLR